MSGSDLSPAVVVVVTAFAVAREEFIAGAVEVANGLAGNTNCPLEVLFSSAL